MNLMITKNNFTLKNIYSFLQAKWRRLISSPFLEKYLGPDLKEYLGFPKHKREQVIFRLCSLENHPQGMICLEKNQCPCNCTTSEVVIADAPCHKNCFDKMMSKEDWDNYKRVNGIYIDLFRKKVIKYVNH
jgi:hypothetical protein